MEKTYTPDAIEQRWYETWENNQYFAPQYKAEDGKDAYCIMIPPPNVTGTLHMGHAFQHSLVDALIRYQRMKGRNTLWQMGTDHAGISTQMLIEEQLAEEGVRAAVAAGQHRLGAAVSRAVGARRAELTALGCAIGCIGDDAAGVRQAACARVANPVGANPAFVADKLVPRFRSLPGVVQTSVALLAIDGLVARRAVRNGWSRVLLAGAAVPFERVGAGGRGQLIAARTDHVRN